MARTSQSKSTTSSSRSAATGKSKAAAATTSKKTASAAAKKQTSTEGEHGSLFEKLFVNMLKDIYGAEQQLVPALQEMLQAATTPDLQDAFEDHIYATQKHAARLERVFSLMGMEAEAKKCEAMEGLIKEAKNVLKETEGGTMTRDAGLIIAAQKVEHYEIASYGSLVQVARTLDQEQVAKILEKTLWEEEDTDMLLTEIAESEVNPWADTEEADTEESDEDENEGMLYTGGDSLGAMV